MRNSIRWQWLGMGMVIVLTTLIVGGCRGKKDHGPQQGDLNSSNGVEQGNGMVQYQNSVLGLSFDYPKPWRLQENETRTRVELDNSPVAEVSLVSSIRFEYSTNIKGVRFSKSDELLSYLKEIYPERNWTALAMLGSKGFISKEVSKKRERQTVYLLDRNRFVLFVEMSTLPDFHGQEVIRAILRSMMIDEEAPVIEEIRFDRTEVKPGETVNLLVKVTDQISGVQIQSMGQKPRFNSSWSWYLHSRNGFMGYVLPPFNKEGPVYVAQWSEWTRSQPFSGDFISLGDDWYSYTLQLPEFSPQGEMAVNLFEVSDYFGNWTRISLFGFNDHSLENNYHVSQVSNPSMNNRGREVEQNNPLKKASFMITHPMRSDYHEDKEPPRLKDIYFSRTSIGQEDMTIDMTLVFEDDSDIYYEYFGNHNSYHPTLITHDIEFSTNEVDGGGSCAKRLTPFVKLEKNTFRIKLDYSNCWDRFKTLPQDRLIIKPSHISVTDAIGLHGNFKSDEINAIPTAAFYVRIR